MAFRFEFDPVNKITLARFEGRITVEEITDSYEAIGNRLVAAGARAGIADLSLVTEIDISSEDVRRLADRESAFPPGLPRVIVAPSVEIFGLSRMFQLSGERRRPELTVVRTMEAALAALGVQSAHFEPIE